LWREDVTPAQVSATLATSRELDRLEETRPALDRRIKRIEEDFQGQFEEEKTLDLAVRKAVRKVERAARALATEEAKPEAERDPLRLQDLRQKLEAAQTEEAQARAALDELYQRGGFGDAIAARVEALRDMEEIDRQIQERILDLDRDVEYFQQPPSLVRFRFPRSETGEFDRQGQISAKFEGWKLPGESSARTYSTEDQSIQDLVFRRKGGVLTFKIVVFEDASLTVEQAREQGVEPRETYCFRLVRNRYDQIGRDPRKFFGGEVFQIQGTVASCDPNDLKTRAQKESSFRMRQGVVKMQDKASRE
jgi:hypothetical protein